MAFESFRDFVNAALGTGMIGNYDENQQINLDTDWPTTKAGAGPVLIFEYVDGLTVTGNTQPHATGSLTYISDSTAVVSQ